MTAFKQVLTNLQAGQREEALIGLEFVLRLDPGFAPATNLQRQLASSSDEIDLGDIIAQLQAPTTEAINGLLIEAVDNFNSRDFLGAKEKVEKVLVDLPGHPEARDLRDQIDNALKIENQVGQFLVQAREALAKGDAQEAANFVMMAQALDPHHTGIASTLKEIDETGGLALSQDAPGVPPQPEPEAPASEAPAASPFNPGDDAEPLTAPLAGSDSGADDAFAVEFDNSDPFNDIVDSSPGGSADAFPGPESGAAAFPSVDDTADLFDAPPDIAESEDADLFDAGMAGSDEVAASGPPDEHSVAEEISSLIEQGQAAYDRHDEPLAIALWSQIFLVKPNHPEAGHLIVTAKKRLAETQAEVDELLGKARDAFDEREIDTANVLVSKALGIRPNHIEITILKEELEREQGAAVQAPSGDEPAEPEISGSPDLPDLEDDLFGDLIDGDAESATDVDDLNDELFSDDLDDDFVDFEQVSLLDRLKSKLPMRLIAVGAAAIVVVLVGVWLGGRFLAPEPEIDDSAAVNEVLLNADRLFKQNKTDEALHLLREFPASGLSQQRIEMRIAKYEETLAPPTPTPIPEEATRAQELLDRGLWWSAFTAAGEGLKVHPGDGGLEEIRALVVEVEPEAASLETALRSGDFRTAVSITEDLLIQYEGQPDLIAVLERSLFNAALAESRAYNLTGAEKHLLRLLELMPDDDEAVRFLEFVQKYKVRAADMRLEIFIRSLNER
jgi:tetratricopeptide (TPR) repeat protein